MMVRIGLLEDTIGNVINLESLLSLMFQLFTSMYMYIYNFEQYIWNKTYSQMCITYMYVSTAPHYITGDKISS